MSANILILDYKVYYLENRHLIHTLNQRSIGYIRKLNKQRVSVLFTKKRKKKICISMIIFLSSKI